MRVGVAFPTTEIGTDPAAIRDYAQAVEAMGFHHLTMIDHVLQEPAQPDAEEWQTYYSLKNMFHEPLVLLGFLAACTTRIQLATAILILPQRPAVLVAKQAAELDILTQGRIRLAVNGQTRQDSTVAHMIWDVAEIISEASRRLCGSPSPTGGSAKA